MVWAGTIAIKGTPFTRALTSILHRRAITASLRPFSSSPACSKAKSPSRAKARMASDRSTPPGEVSDLSTRLNVLNIHGTASPKQSSADSDLIAALHALSAKSPKLVKSSTYPAPADPSITVRSWKMNEFKYYDIPSPFPTLARGLFTREIGTEGGKDGAGKTTPRYQIVVRGYDKFFNIGEVPWTFWDSIEKHTAPPYVLSLKSNGCIIFIAALTPEKLLITSKHSLGPVAGQPLSHAQAGEMWLRKYLTKLGKEEKDLAGVLWEKNWTAIAELCDDDFEEHVLGYPPEKTGLHLHGLNVRSKEFETMPAEMVDAFAEEWGFIKTPHITLNTIKEVQDFTKACAEAGEWNGEAVEGFVVRSHVSEPPTAGRHTAAKDPSQSPYKPGSSFFFKVKFDEPYMMYRDWREVTKTLLSKGLDATLLPKSKMKRAETKLYVQWAIREIKRNPKAFEGYTKGKGIIATREMYLSWLKSGEGLKGLQEVEKEDQQQGGSRKFGKTIILPVAIPGCGKTVVSVALAHLFGFGHTQSDDVHAKKPAPIFIKNVTNLLANMTNNHLRMHRQSLRDATKNEDPPVRLLALNWSLDKPPAAVHRICGDRVLVRGDNHQTLRADATSKAHEDVIWMFINTTEELTPAEVDEVIDMELEEGLEAAVRRAVAGCVRILGLAQPSDAQIAEALAVAQGYAPTTKKPDEPKDKKKAKAPPRYYGLLPEVDLVALLDARLSAPDAEGGPRIFWAKTQGRQAKAMDTERAVWDRCEEVAGLPLPPVFKGRLGSVLCNGRAMAVTVEDLALEAGVGGDGKEGEAFLDSLPREVRNRLHITVGTKEPKIEPVEAKDMVEAWRAKGADGGIIELKLDPVEVRGRVKGLNG
ncbi:RNA ligase [Pholiota molesta]|nr:RNA ligase [Pholiota molesta]